MEEGRTRENGGKMLEIGEKAMEIKAT